MKLAISNIAWGRHLDDEFLRFLRASGCDGLELAPGLLDWKDLDTEESALVAMLGGTGLEMVGLHSLLFEVPHLRIVDKTQWQILLEHCDKLTGYCKRLGGRYMVFGSPGSRSLEGCSAEAAWNLAVEFFRQLAQMAAAHDIVYLIEPLPTAEIVRNSKEGVAMVTAVAHVHFALHLDIRTMVCDGEDPSTIIDQRPFLRHVHIGGPDLGFIGPDDGIQHMAFARALDAAGFDGYVTLEMLRQTDAPDLPRLKAAVKFARGIYC